MSGSSYYSHNDLRLHFGIGAATMIDSLEVRWPSGTVQKFERIEPNRRLVIHEEKGIA